jgi:precorrin-6B methylase 2
MLYDELIEKEIVMAQITKNTNVLVIGCGSLPVTPILIGSKTDANIIGIDYDKKAVDRAINFINKHYPRLKIKIEHADGISYPIEKYDVIFVLYGVKNQNEILKNISKKIGDNKHIILRTTQDYLNKKYGGYEKLSEMFKIKDSLGSDSIYTSYSYLLTKK